MLRDYFLGPSLALHLFDSAIAAARRQQRRISAAIKKTAIGKWHHRQMQGTIFDDVHFYAISGSRIAKLAKYIRDVTGFRRAGIVVRNHNRHLREMIDLRDHLEHLDERLPGGKNVHRMNVPSDLFNIVNESVSFGGRRVDIGRESMRRLETFRKEFRSELLVDAAEYLASKDLKCLNRILRRAASQADQLRSLRRVRLQLRLRAGMRGVSQANG